MQNVHTAMESSNWKTELTNVNLMNMRNIKPSTIPHFSKCTWLISVHIIPLNESVSHHSAQSSAPQSSSYGPSQTQEAASQNSQHGRLCLLLRQAAQGLWTLPGGKATAKDISFQTATRRIIREQTGFKMKDIVGACGSILVDNEPPRDRDGYLGTIRVAYFATVKEVPSSIATEEVKVTLSNEYCDSKWTRDVQNALNLQHFGIEDRRFPQQPLELQAATGLVKLSVEDKGLAQTPGSSPYCFDKTMAYLDMAPAAIPYKDRCVWLICAVIKREKESELPAIMLISRASNIWSLIGCRNDFFTKTVRGLLHASVVQEIGLPVKEILGPADEMPQVVQPPQRCGKHDNRDRVLLPYVVTVKEGQVKLMDGYSDWCWVDVETAKGLRMSEHSFNTIERILKAEKSSDDVSAKQKQSSEAPDARMRDSPIVLD